MVICRIMSQESLLSSQIAAKSAGLRSPKAAISAVVRFKESADGGGVPISVDALGTRGQKMWKQASRTLAPDSRHSIAVASKWVLGKPAAGRRFESSAGAMHYCFDSQAIR